MPLYVVCFSLKGTIFVKT